MILIDTGPLVAILDQGDSAHTQCSEQLQRLKLDQFMTSWSRLTEAMYFLHKIGGYRYVSKLWGLYQDGILILHDLSKKEMNRMASLMLQYHDTPMDLADASLVAMAESFSFKKIFTLDSDFNIYRLEDDSVLEIFP